MRFEPRPYQQILADHIIATPRCAGWADMGMGKTVSTLTALDLLSLIENPYPALVLAPLRVARTVWPREAKKWDHLHEVEVSAVVGDETARKRALRADANVFTTNYEQIPWLVMNYFNKGAAWPFRTVIADESTKLKSFRLKKGGHRAAMLARVAFHPKVKRWVNLTGTPAPNGLLDLWGQTYFLDSGERLGRSFTGFTERFFRPHPSGFGHEPLPFAEEQIHERLRDLCLTIKAKDWFDVNEPIVNKILVDLPPAAMKEYKRMERDLFAQLDGVDIEAFSAAARSQKCLQMASGAVYKTREDGDPIDRSKEWVEAHKAKLEALDEVIDGANGPVLVAYHFKSDLARLLKRYKTAREIRTERDEDDWNAGKIPIGLVHPASIGHGSNLHYGGNVLVFFSVDWNLENHDQIIERIGPVRQLQAGFDRPVYIHYILARRTLDLDVMARLTTKRDVQDLLKEAMARRRD